MARNEGKCLKRKVLSLKDRMNVLIMSEAGKSCRKIAIDMGVGKTQIQQIVKEKELIMKEWTNGGNMERKYSKKRKTGYEDLNELVWQWFCELRSWNISVSGKLMQEKALMIAKEQGLDSFAASNGWLEAFKKRHNIRPVVSSREDADVSGSIADDWKKRLASICDGYAAKNVFNADEMGLYYRALPTQSMVVKKEFDGAEKNNEEWMTVFLCCSAMGEKLEPFIIGKSQQPKCFRGKIVPGMYAANKKAWMTSELFMMWLSKINNEMKIQNRRIILFVDKCCAHPDIELSNVKLMFLPPNTTTKLQPCVIGIIQAVKSAYRKRLLTHVLFHMKNSANASAIEFAKKVSILDAISWLKFAWDNLSTVTIVKCFKKCGFCPKGLTEETGPEAPNEIPADLVELLDGVNWEEYVTMDDTIITSNNTVGDQWEDILRERVDVETKKTTESDEEEDDDKPLRDVISPRVASRYLADVKEFALEYDNPELMDLLTKCQHVLEMSKWLPVKKANKLR